MFIKESGSTYARCERAVEEMITNRVEDTSTLGVSLHSKKTFCQISGLQNVTVGTTESKSH